MKWGNRNCDWEGLISVIQMEIDANKKVIPEDRLDDIQHYLNHDELSSAFEYLYLEIMERENAKFTMGAKAARNLALFFGLNDERECTIDADFWPKFEAFLTRTAKHSSYRK